MAAQPLPASNPLQVVGVCGQTIEFLVNGVAVSVTCLPPQAPQERPPPAQRTPQPSPPIFRPDPTPPPYTAALSERIFNFDLGDLDAEMFPSSEEITENDPLVIRIDTSLGRSDFDSALESAREQQRPLRFELE